MNECEKLAYAAGIIDGEGCVTIAVDMSRLKKQRCSPAFLAYLCVSMTNPEPIQLLYELFGGHISDYHARTKNNKKMYFWSVGTKQVSEVLRKLYPYLLVKRPHAEVIFRFQQLKDHPRKEKRYLAEMGIRNTRWGPRPYHRYILRPEIIEEFHKFVLEIRVLNGSRKPDPLADYLRIGKVVHPLT